MTIIHKYDILKLTKFKGGTTQATTLGVDTGYSTIGFSLVTESKCLLASQLKLDNKTSSRLKYRAMYRQNRRNRHHWYRPARWQNRANARKEGRLMPSVLKRLNRHIWLIEKLRALCHVSEVRIETASFDIQKIVNPEIAGTGYQQGDKFGYLNLRAFLFARESCVCQYCSKKIEPGQCSHIHHIVTRANGGTDRAGNFALLHEKCHELLHKRKDFSKLRKAKQYKAETAMAVIRKRLLEKFYEAKETFGYITSGKRQELCLVKTHATDAFVIAGGELQQLPKELKLIERHRNNRSLQIQRNGYKPAIRRKRYPHQPNDLIWVGKVRYVVAGTNCKGKNIVTRSKKNIATSNVTRSYPYGTVALEQ